MFIKLIILSFKEHRRRKLGWLNGFGLRRQFFAVTREDLDIVYSLSYKAAKGSEVITDFCGGRGGGRSLLENV